MDLQAAKFGSVFIRAQHYFSHCQQNQLSRLNEDLAKVNHNMDMIFETSLCLIIKI